VTLQFRGLTPSGCAYHPGYDKAIDWQSPPPSDVNVSLVYKGWNGSGDTYCWWEGAANVKQEYQWSDAVGTNGIYTNSCHDQTSQGCPAPGGCHYRNQQLMYFWTAWFYQYTDNHVGVELRLNTAVLQWWQSHFYVDKVSGIICDGPITVHNEESSIYDGGVWLGAQTGGTCTIVPGVTEDPSVSCPGGDPIYTHTDLSEHYGKVVKLSDGVWYKVDGYGSVSDGEVTVVASGDSCGAVC
jgi:hypothetical protein